jgi:hypothetical protein
MVISKLTLSFLLRAAGFGEPIIPKMICIAEYESSFRTDAVNVNKDKSVDRGLYQINDKWWSKECPWDMFNPGDNVRCAKVVFDRMGLKGWVAHIKGKCDHVRIK